MANYIHNTQTDEAHTTPTGAEFESGLELAMQELEALEAPGWWTAAGVVAGVGATAVASYIGVTIATT